jgi:MFS family permease
MAQQKRIFYGWTIVGISFITLTISFGIWYSFSVFFVSILKHFEWSRAATAGIFSIFMIVHSAATLLIGPLLDRFGPRWIIPLGALLTVFGLLATSQIDTLWKFYLCYGVITAFGLCSTGFASHSIFLPRWFDQKRGFALGIAMAGAGVGMLVIVPFSQHLIEQFGWRVSYCVLAAMVLVFIVPLNMIFQRKGPDEIGVMPNGRTIQTKHEAYILASASETLKTSMQPKESTLHNSLKESRFWILLMVYFYTPMATQGPLVHQVAHVVDKGFSASKGAFIFGLTGIMGSMGKILFGYFSDRIGREKAFVIGMGCAFAGILSLMSIQPGRDVLLYGYALLFGLGYGSIAPIFPARAADLFQGPQFGQIFAFFAIAAGAGGGLGVWLYGKIFDISSSYRLSFIIVLLTIVLISVLFWFSTPPSQNRKHELV